MVVVVGIVVVGVVIVTSLNLVVGPGGIRVIAGSRDTCCLMGPFDHRSSFVVVVVVVVA